MPANGFSVKKRMALAVIASLASVAPSGSLRAKSPIVRVTIAGGDLPKTVEISDTSILERFNIWSGPGNFRMEGSVRIPIVQDGSIMWSQGPVAAPSNGLPQYEISFHGKFPEERIMYVVVYRYDPTAQQGYIHLPGKNEKWHEVNVRSIYRGVEGNWYHAAKDFDGIVVPLIRPKRASQ